MNKNFKKINKKINQKGFTLLETLIAIFILTLTITAPVYIASLSFLSTIYNRDTVTAQYIAEEVIEVIRNKRDEKALQDGPIQWTTLIDNQNCVINAGAQPDNKCYMVKNIITETYDFRACPINGTCPNISFDPESDDVIYGKSSISITSKFIREFYIQRETVNGNDADGVKIVVNIKWSDKGVNKIYTLTERLYKVDYNEFFLENQN